MRSVVVFLADGVEEIEGLTTVDLLRRADIKVTTASVMGRQDIRAAHGVVIKADILAEDADFSSFDMAVLPGGGEGTENLSKSDIVKEQCLSFAKNKMLAAICAAPTVLAGLSLLEGRKATCYPGMEGMMHGAVMTEGKVVVDGNIITGQAPAAAVLFALELIRQLKDEKTMEEVAKGIVL